LKFKGAVDMVKSLDGRPWLHTAATKIVFDKLYGPITAFALAEASNLAKYQAAATEVQCHYVAALFFHGLSNKAHRDLKNKVHNDALTGSSTIPCTFAKVLQLADQCKSFYQQRQPGSGGGIIFVQKGKAARAAMAARMAMTATAATAPSSTKKLPHQVPGEKDNKRKMLANSLSKQNCFNCGCDNHWVVNCPKLTAAQHKEIMGMDHVSIGNEEFKGTCFLQNKSVNPCVVAMHKTLDPRWLYLDSTPSFHQVFTEEHLDNLRLAGAALHANCKADTNFATKRGWYHDLFDLW
jgi:hypothetical protein